ncbi:hypothetical protein M074_1691 [Bacteroides fragilis str. DS-166]|nr:hypothetical protein M074_1698 [Bacteroides fragilis str. DS-166]EXZ83699.1 hypothetical protein M069_1891 [Bacteroides fragilis str. B1 (UDC16-1)]EYB05844.1 hypothetical protein M129_1716 [Bacteroides fragilis str. S6R5]EYE55212.1 hypothetical protein M131_1635 [Bacteroides fragilis str. S6R8]EXZ01045.1 hypothetical protein M074_1692 [Bacteroides fragilis str. DS-166]
MHYCDYCYTCFFPCLSFSHSIKKSIFIISWNGFIPFSFFMEYFFIILYCYDTIAF